jgi:hypothetical protein
MSFIRPEVTAALYRWREVLAGLGLALGALRRMRFRAAAPAPGVVQIVEGQLAYFGPETGGFAALTEVEELRLEPGEAGPVWVLEQPGGPLVIPVGAVGSEALADWVAALPDIEMSALHAALGRPNAGPRVLWRRRSLARLPGRGRGPGMS